MTRRCSLRAQAREIYRDLVKARVASSHTPLIPAQAGIQGDHATPVDEYPGSPLSTFALRASADCKPAEAREASGGGSRGRAEGEQNLTKKVRALYEDSAVPVREIASVAGVTERTIYKYAAKLGWKRRHHVAPARGAGSRFIRREDKDKPFARGLKATDPAGAARAAESCGAAASLSRAAQREARKQAEAAQRSDALNRAIELNNGALRNLREFHEGRGKGPPGPLDIRAEDILMRVVEMALAQVQALVVEEERLIRPNAH